MGEDVEEIDEENRIDQERSREKGLGYTVYFPIPVADQAPDDDEDEDDDFELELQGQT
ncbi:hypothetical protein [Rhizobium leguminosarum]|uniref:hypothetical protein n=1 Tax=Rhizobium leguminosarum TaxID=384 RepID=UPI001441936D|nr:hypothetical protein [Rhizobium leguminosarum]MBY3026497.1 hypothetical protein [Rhizobium leguminosarum]